MIRRVFIKNYKSIGAATVDLGQFCAIVGANASGKSNFVDALSFVADALSDSVEVAFRNRGGIGAVRRKSIGHPRNVGIRLLIELPDGSSADYAFEIAAEAGGRFTIARERCHVQRILSGNASFEVERGKFKKEIPGIRPRVEPDRLALFAASATEEFRDVFDFLTSMRFYSIAPSSLRELQEPDTGEYLQRDGSNAAAVLRRLRQENTESYERVCRLLARVVPGIQTVEYRDVGHRETLQFRQDIGDRSPWLFEAHNMSDGTLRAFGILLAVYQPGKASVIVIEEPESSVNPAVMELIVQVLLDASHRRQVIFTTHSPEILDYEEIDDASIRVVMAERNSTAVAPLSQTTRSAIREHLYSPGELLRVGELRGDAAAAESAARQAETLFSVVDLSQE